MMLFGEPTEIKHLHIKHKMAGVAPPPLPPLPPLSLTIGPL
jgi:hypothetical protein